MDHPGRFVAPQRFKIFRDPVFKCSFQLIGGALAIYPGRFVDRDQFRIFIKQCLGRQVQLLEASRFHNADLDNITLFDTP